MIVTNSAAIRSALISAALAAASVISLAATARADGTPIATGQQTNGKARAEITALQRTEGDTVTLRFTIVNDNNDALSLTLANMTLLDLVNRRSYEPGVTSPACRIPSGERRTCWAVFAAPGAGVRTLNVSFYEDFGLIPVPVAN